MTAVLLASTRRLSAMLAPKTQVPGPSADGGGASVLCENTLTMFDRLHRVVQRGLEQHRRHLHREGRAHQHQMADALLRLRRRFQRNQRAAAVADQRRLFHAGGVQQRGDEVGRFLDAGGRLAGAPAVAGQVDRQHVPAVVGQVAGLQDPDAVVVEHAVDEDDGGLGRVEGLAAGVAVGLGAVDE